MRETIFALSSAPGTAGVAVVRLSGPRAHAAVAALLGGDNPPPPRRASLAGLRDPSDGRLLDRALVLRFPGPASFTGEDVAELHLHGGRAVVAAVLDALGRQEGLRPAEPGEFTRRAFDAGKLDLSAVEGLADLIAAETEAQRRQALRQMEGGLAELVEGWRDRLVPALAHLEAAIDFPDEDLPADLDSRVAGQISPLIDALAGHLDDDRSGERLREGVMVAIVGPPNAGKSSLLNALARRDVAIVSAQPGTTRDVVEVHLDLGGYPVTLADTAGLRALPEEEDPQQEIEREGMRRTRTRMAQADLTVAVLDASHFAAGAAPSAEEVQLVADADVLVLNKSDLLVEGWKDGDTVAGVSPAQVFVLSALRGDGLAAFLDRLTEEVGKRLSQAVAAPGLTRARHRVALQDCREALTRALEAPAPELAAEDLRLAVRALGRITGRVDVEDILDVVFRDFCIGK